MNKIFTLTIGLLATLTAMAQSEIKTTIGGDMRIRHESTDIEGTSNDFDRLRLRARLGVKAQMGETLSAELRMATGAGGTGTNQTLSGTVNYNFLLDRAYLKYANGNVSVKAGRTDNPFASPGDNNMLFDGDLNFDGASVNYAHKMDSMTANLVLAHTIIREVSAAAPNTDVQMNSAQLSAKMDGETHSFMAMVAEHAISDLKGTAAVVSFNGNSNASNLYLYNYDITTFGLEYGFKGMAVPMTFYAEMANNNRTSENDTATIYGIRFNKVKKKGDWMVGIENREVEADSTVSFFSDSDSFGGGTNGKSLNISAGYGLDDNANLLVTYFNGKTNIGSGQTEADNNRVFVDLSIKF